MKKYIILSPILTMFLIYSTAYACPTKFYDSLVVDNVSDRVFASAGAQTGIDVIEMETGKVTKILAGETIVTVALDEKAQLLAAIGQDKILHIISTETLDLLAGIPLTGEATSLAIDPGLKLAIVTLSEGKVGFVDLNTYAVFEDVETLDKPVSVAVDPHLHLAIVVHEMWGKGNDQKRDNLTIIDLISRSIVGTVLAGKNPVQAAVNPITHEAAVANGKSNDLTLIDLTNLSVKESIPVGKHPKSLAYNECLNTLSIVGGENKGWLQVMNLNTGENEAYYDLEARPQIIKVYRYLNKAAISTKEGLITTDLPNPVPELISINPERALRGEESHDILLRGSGLLSITKIYFDGNEAGTTLPGCRTMSVGVPDEYLQKTGQIEITAANLLPGGGTSNPLYLKIENPVPTLTVLDPMEIEAGAPALVVTGYGMGFFDDTTVYIDGISRPFAHNGLSIIQTQLDAEDLESGRYLEITAANPEPGGGISNQLIFTVLNPAPELSAIDPQNIIAGSPEFEIGLTGENFVKTSIVSFNNRQCPVTYMSSTKLGAAIPADAIITPGGYTVKVINPVPGGGESQPHTFTVKPPIEVEITSPTGGDTVNRAKTLVKGTIKSDTRDVGVSVNGILAEIKGKEWLADGVPLVTGPNKITATLTDSAGNRASSSITVNALDSTQQVNLSSNTISGIAPLTTHFAVTADMPGSIANYQIDFEGDGVIDYVGETFEDVNHTYETEGFFYPTVSVTDAEGNTYSDTIAITALNKAEVEDILREKWEGLKGALREKNTEKALNFFVDTSKERYGPILDVLKDQMPMILDTFVEFNITDYYDSVAEYEIVADENGVLYSYPGLFVKDGSGIWKFRDF